MKTDKDLTLLDRNDPDLHRIFDLQSELTHLSHKSPAHLFAVTRATLQTAILPFVYAGDMSIDRFAAIALQPAWDEVSKVVTGLKERTLQ